MKLYTLQQLKTAFLANHLHHQLQLQPQLQLMLKIGIKNPTMNSLGQTAHRSQIFDVHIRPRDGIIGKKCVYTITIRLENTHDEIITILSDCINIIKHENDAYIRDFAGNDDGEDTLSPVYLIKQYKISATSRLAENQTIIFECVIQGLYDHVNYIVPDLVALIIRHKKKFSNSRYRIPDITNENEEDEDEILGHPCLPLFKCVFYLATTLFIFCVYCAIFILFDYFF